MRWEGRRQSENVEDRRRVVAGPMVLRGGIGTIVLLLVLLFLGVSPQELLHNIPELVGPQPAPQQPVSPDQNENDELKQFVSVVLADTEDVWGTIFPTSFLKPYSPPTLVLFTGQVKSACGLASALPVPSIARSIRRSTSIWRFTKNCDDALGLQVTLRSLRNRS